MAITQVLLMCLGLCLLAKNADAQAALTQTTITVAENIGNVAAAVGQVTASGSPDTVTILSQTNDGQFAVNVKGDQSAIEFSLTAGFELDYEAGATLSVVVQLVVTTGSHTSSGTVAITVTDVNEEFESTIMSVCLSGTTYGTGSSLTTKIASATGVTAAYSLVSQVPDVAHLALNTATGEITVAAGKTLTAEDAPVYTANIKLISSAPATTTSTAAVYIVLGCGSTSAATLVTGSITLLLAMFVALLQ